MTIRLLCNWCNDVGYITADNQEIYSRTPELAIEFAISNEKK